MLYKLMNPLLNKPKSDSHNNLQENCIPQSHTGELKKVQVITGVFKQDSKIGCNN